MFYSSLSPSAPPALAQNQAPLIMKEDRSKLTSYNTNFLSPFAPPKHTLASSHSPSKSFFGTEDANSELSREMLLSVIFNKTQWVIHAQHPIPSFMTKVFTAFTNLFTTSNRFDQLDDHERSVLWRQAGELDYAKMVGNSPSTTQAERKTDQIFQAFINELSEDEKKAKYCFEQSILLSPSQEAYFDLGKLHFLMQRYDQAIESFQKADECSLALKRQTHGSENSYHALAKSCVAACEERLGYHDKALFNYVDAAKIDPDGPNKYREALDRNFQILKFKPEKNKEELQACMDFDPFEPNFVLEAAHLELPQNPKRAVQLLNKANELSYNYKPQVFYRCAELSQQIANVINNPLGAH